MKNHLKLDNWSSDISNSQDYNTIFVKNLEDYIQRQFFTEVQFLEESPEIEIIETNNSKMNFERADFYDTLINILLNQDEVTKESLKIRGNYLKSLKDLA